MTLETGLRRRFSPPPDASAGMPLRLGRVIAVENSQRRVDLAMERGEVVRAVPCLTNFAGTHIGSPFIGSVENPAGTAQTGSGPYADMTPSLKKDTFAVVGYVGGDLHRPYVLGFLFPEQFETSFEDIEVTKHENGMYSAYTEEGFEFSHPSGFFVKIGSGFTKTDLNAENHDATSVPFDDTDGSATAVPDVAIEHPTGLAIHITSAGALIIVLPSGQFFNLGTHTHSGVTVGAGNSGGPVLT